MPIDGLPILDKIPTGVYAGWARRSSETYEAGEAEMAVLSVGWNPQYANTVKTLEVHILRTYEDDFYGEPLRLVIVGYLRAMKKYPTLEGLIEAIEKDKADAKVRLQEEDAIEMRVKNMP
jgi:FAD synthase